MRLVFPSGCLLAVWLSAAGLANGAGPGGELPDFSVRNWSAVAGLPNDGVTALLQTHDGYLWVGTGAGLVRFDGFRFTPVALGRSPRGTVAVTALCEDGADRLWVGTPQGLFVREQGPFRRFGAQDGLLDEGVTSLAVDKANGVWVGTRRGVHRWNGQAFTAYTTREGLPDDSVSALHAAPSGTVWITTRGGICRSQNGRIARYDFESTSQGRNPEPLGVYEDQRGNLWAFGATYLVNLAEGKRFNYFRGETPSAARIWGLCQGQKGRLWIGTSGRGVFCFDGSRFQPVSAAGARWPEDVRTIYEDREGNVWLGLARNGLVQLRPQAFELLNENQGLPAGAATCVLLDGAGHICAGMEAGGVYCRQGTRFEELTRGLGLVSQDAAAALSLGPERSLWVGTLSSGLYQLQEGRAAGLNTANGLSDDCVLSLCSDGQGVVWAGTGAGTLHRFGGGPDRVWARAEGLSGAPLTVLLADGGGGLWVGTRAGTLFHWNASAPSLAPVPLTRAWKDKSILALHQDLDGRLWLGSEGGGLGCLAGGRFRCWNTNQGLPEEVISGIVQDNRGNLWLEAGKGVCQIGAESLKAALARPVPLEAKVVFESDGKANRGAALGWPRAVRSAEGLLWFATASGVLGINPSSCEKELPPPPVHLEAVLVNDQPLELARVLSGNGSNAAAQSVALGAKLTTLEIQFTAPFFAAPEKLKFRHKLEGLDPDWVDGGGERRVRYGRLASGQYRFRVAVCSPQGLWSPRECSFAFWVAAPLWRTAWFLSFYGLSAIGAVAGTVRFVSHRRLRRQLVRLEQQQATERERLRIAQDMHDEIGSKLTKLSYLSERTKGEVPAEAPVRARLEAIAYTSRDLLKALDEIVWAVNPRNDTLEHLAAYLSQYAKEYFRDTPVECQLRMPEQLPAETMSAEVRHGLFLSFQEALNNVLKHARAGRVRIALRVEAGQFQISISDNGRGFAPELSLEGRAKPGGNGLVNMRQRLAQVGGRCRIESRPGLGTEVSLSIALPGRPQTSPPLL
jgi:ligand-binding sensor domain-containing protein/signal transduction histidine kinase